MSWAARLVRLVFALCVVAIAAGLLPATVRGHAELLATSPEANASLPASPQTVELEFSEPVAAENATVELTDATGAGVDGLGAVAVVADGRTVTVELPELEAAVYTVRFRVVSALDGHAAEGAFAFQVDPSGTQPPLTGTATSTTAAAHPATVVARWVGLAGALALFGTALFWLVTGRPALAMAEPARERRGVWRALAALSLAAVTGLAVFLTLSSRGLATVQPGSGHSHFALDFAGPFGDTLFANAMRVVELTMFAAFFLAVTRATRGEEAPRPSAAGVAPGSASTERRGERVALLAVLLLAAAALAGYSVAGHVSAAGGPLFAVVDWAHLLAAATWLGTLPGLLLLFAVYTPRLPDTARRLVLGAALRRHSAVALVAAPVVALTGIASSPVVVGESRNIVSSDYGTLISAKILLFSAALAIGSANFFLLRRASFGRMAGTVSAELGIGALAVLVAASLGTTPPAGGRPERAVSPPARSLVLAERASDTTIRLVVTAPVPARQLFQAAVLEPDGRSHRTDVQKLFLVFEPPPGSELPPQRVEAEPVVSQPGLFRVSGSYTPVLGDWSVEVIVRRAGVRDASASFDLPISEPEPVERVRPGASGLGVPDPLRAAWAVLPPPPFEWLLPAALFAIAGAGFLIAQGRRSTPPGTRRFVERVRLGLVAAAVLTGLLAGSRMLVTAVNAAPEEAAAAVNPVPADEASIARGARAYHATCAACHAANRVEVAGHTDGELFYWITNGAAGTSMPPFAMELAPRDRWDVVNYLRTLPTDE